MSSIGKEAFFGCGNLYAINLGTGLKKIGYGAFSVYKKLKDVFCSAVNPPSIGHNSYNYDDYYDYYANIYRSYAFDNASSLTAHVPSSCVDIYKNSVGWKEFGNIVSIEE